jgi:type VI protein secretion system component VasA
MQIATFRRSGKSKSIAVVTITFVSGEKRLQQNQQVMPAKSQSALSGLICEFAPIRSIAAATHAEQIWRLLSGLSRRPLPMNASTCGTVLRQNRQVVVSARLRPTGLPQDVQNLAPSASFCPQREHLTIPKRL